MRYSGQQYKKELVRLVQMVQTSEIVGSHGPQDLPQESLWIRIAVCWVIAVNVVPSVAENFLALVHLRGL